MAGPEPRRSWVDVALDGIARLPGPTWLAYVIGAVVLTVTGTALALADGTVHSGTFSFIRIFTDARVIYQLAVLHFLLWSAGEALRAFAPALGTLASEYGALEQRLTRVPVWISVLAIPLGLAYAAAFLIGDPEGVGLGASSSVALRVFVTVTTVIGGVTFALLVLVVLRQLATIVRIHARATAISIFDAQAHGAFARVTLRASVGLALPVYVFTAYQLIAGNPDGEITLPELITVVALVGGAVGIFFIPLIGIHRRLVQQRSALLTGVLTRLEAAMREVGSKADSGDRSGLDELEKLVTVLLLERDAVRKLSAWPWEGETFRAFLTSIALPIVIWFITTLLGRLLGS